MTKLEIHPSELYPTDADVKPPRPGAPLSEWKVYWRGRKKAVNPPDDGSGKYLPANDSVISRVCELSGKETQKRIAEIVGCSEWTVYQVQKKYDLPRFKKGRQFGCVVTPTPGWVPADIVADYRKRLKNSGEIVAARWARRRMAGLPTRGFGSFDPRGQKKPEGSGAEQ